MTTIKKPLLMAREYIASCVSGGDFVVDATAGNGRDTLFLAQMVGNGGKVFSFDLQKEALTRTQKLLEDEGLLHRVRLIHSGHEHMGNYLDKDISAAMFNLGYLPGGEHSIVTRPETTIAALERVLQRLREGGLVTLVIYCGHEGGRAEKEALSSFGTRLKQQDFTVLYYDIINQVHSPPSLMVVEKVKRKI